MGEMQTLIENKEAAPVPDLQSVITQTTDYLMAEECQNPGQGVEKLLEKTISENWGQSDDVVKKLIYQDLNYLKLERKIAPLKLSLSKANRPTFSIDDNGLGHPKSINKTEIQELEEQLRIIDQEIEALKSSRLKDQSFLPEELKDQNILLFVENYINPATKSRYHKRANLGVAQNSLNSYSGVSLQIDYLRKNNPKSERIAELQIGNLARLSDYLQSLDFSPDHQNPTNKYLSKIRADNLVNIYKKINGEIPQELVDKIKRILSLKTNQVGDVIQEYTEQDVWEAKEAFKNGTLDHCPNTQEYLGAYLLVDLFEKINGVEDEQEAFDQWYSHWGAKNWDQQTQMDFIELILKIETVRLTLEEKQMIEEGLSVLYDNSSEKLNLATQVNEELGDAKDIAITRESLFHECDLSVLPAIFHSGVLANELSQRSRNQGVSRESDFAASFWMFASESQISLEDAIQIFNRRDSIRTAAQNRSRVLLVSLDPESQVNGELILHPPDSHQNVYYDPNKSPWIKKIIKGAEAENKSFIQEINGENTPVVQDVAYVLLGIPAVSCNAVILPDELIEKYRVLAQEFPFYIPAYSLKTGAKLY